MLQHSKPTIGAEEIGAVTKVLQSGYIAQGPVVREFEKQFEEYIGAGRAIAINSGSSALHLSLTALGIGSGDRVILPSYVCAAVLNTIKYVGAEAELCDVSDKDLNLRAQDVKKLINKRTKAVILTHTFGQPADMDEFPELGIPIIEDCAQSLGAKWRGKRVGSFGSLSVFSFYATKMITTGYGGMVVTDSESLAGKVRDLREYDERQDYKVRYNYKMSDIEAALGLSQIARLNTFISRRREIAQDYDEIFSRYGIKIPYRKRKADHVFFRYVIKARGDLERVIRRLGIKGIEAKRPVYRPLHHYLGLNKRDFPNTEEAHNSVLSIPLYPSLKRNETEFIAKTAAEVVLENDLSRTSA